MDTPLNFQVPLDEPDPQAGTISLAPTTPQVTYPPDYVDVKASRYDAALGPQSPGIDTLRADVTNSDTQNWDDYLATVQDQSDSAARKGVVTNWATTRDPFAPMSDDEISHAHALLHTTTTQDPNTAMSKKLSNDYVNLVHTVTGNVITPKAFTHAGNDKTLDHIDAQALNVQRALIAQDQFKGIVSSRENESIGTTALSVLKGLVPGYDMAVTDNAVQNTPATHYLIGNNWTDQISYLYSLPPDEMREKLANAVSDIATHDPSLAEQFARAVVSYSQSDVAERNVQSLANVAMLPLGGASRVAGRILSKGIDLAASRKAIEIADAVAGGTKAAPEEVFKNATAGVQPHPDWQQLPAPTTRRITTGDREAPTAGDETIVGTDQTRGKFPDQSADTTIQLPDKTGVIYGKDERAVQGPPERQGPPEAQGPSKNTQALPTWDPENGWVQANPQRGQTVKLADGTITKWDPEVGQTQVKTSTGESQNMQLRFPGGLDEAGAASLYKGKGGLPVPYVPRSTELTVLADQSEREIAEAGKKIVSAALNDPKDLPEIAGKLGLNEVAAKTEMANNIAAGDPSGLTTLIGKPATAIESRLPTAMSPARAYQQVSDLATAAKAKIQQTSLKVQALAKAAQSKFVTDVQRVDRLEPGQVSFGANEAFDKIRDIFQSNNFNIMDYNIGHKVHMASEDPVTNLYSVSVKLGQRDGTLFPTEDAAKDFIRRNISPRTNDYRIGTDGVGGYYAEIRRNISEVGNIRDFELPTDNKTPGAFWNQIGGFLRSADYQLPKAQVLARGRVVHGEEFGAQMLHEITQPITKLSRAEKDGLEKLLTSERQQRKFARTDADFRSEYLARVGHMPTTALADAHRAIVDLHDLDYAIRDADVVMQKSRLGGERFTISLKPNAENPEGGPKSFDGLERDHLPWASKDPFFVQRVEDGVAGTKRSSRYALTDDKFKADLATDVSNGYKIVLNPEESTYYVVKNVQRDRIPMGTLGFQDGGHDIYHYDNYIKQADIRPVQQGIGNPIRHYRGDLSLASAPTTEHGAEIAKLINQGRELFLKNDPTAGAFWTKNLHDFMSLADLQKSIGAGDFKLDIPVFAVKKGQRTTDVGGNWTKSIENFLDGTKNDHNVFSSVSGQFIGEKSTYQLDVLRAEAGRVVKTSHEALLNPWDTMRQATQNLLDTRVANDYRQKVTADWLQEFGHAMEGDWNYLNSNPLDALNNVVWKKGADPRLVAAGENVRLRTLQLNNYRTLLDRQVESYKGTITDWAYEHGGPKARDFMNDTVLPNVSNIDTHMRSVAYQFKMGLFNPKQFFTQASEFMKIFAVSPIHAPNAIKQLIVNRMAIQTTDQAVLKAYASKWANFMGVDKDDWVHQINAFKRSGFSIVGHDQGYLDSVSATAVDKSGLRKGVGAVLNAGTTPFREGELVARNLAYSTAWREFKASNPGAVIDRYAETKILQRAKDLTNNMGRDSNAAWQKGNLAVVTQFFGYHARFMEQLWDGGIFSNGQKLSRAEKLRTVVAMGALYGAPMAAGGVLGVVPIKSMLKDWMAQTGQLPDSEDSAPDPLIDGMLPYMIHAMTGENYDLSNSYGPSGIPAFYELFNGDKTWTDILSGASGGIVADTAKQALGATANVISDALNIDDGSPGVDFNVTAQDFLQPLQNITTVDAAKRVWQVVNTGKWISKSGSVLKDDATFGEALSSAIFGVQPQSISDTYAKFRGSSRVYDAQSAAQKDVAALVAKSTAAANSGDMNASQIYFRRAKAIAIQNGLTPTQYNQAFRKGWDERPLNEQGDQTYTKFKQRNLQNKAVH